MLRFAGPIIVTLGLVAGKELFSFSVLGSIGANGSRARAVGFGEGVLVLCWDGSDGGSFESVFVSGTFAGFPSAAGNEVEVCHCGGKKIKSTIPRMMVASTGIVNVTLRDFLCAASSGRVGSFVVNRSRVPSISQRSCSS